MHKDIQEKEMNEIRYFLEEKGHQFFPISCANMLSEEDEAKISRYYSIEMYYWLFAPFLLPEEVDRILYLDPDIVCMNPVNDFYEQSFGRHLFVASSHQYLTKWLQPINKLRLNTDETESYFNSGVVLMDLEALRKKSSMETTVETIEDSNVLMWLPDQDVFNRLYSGKIKEADWRLYNLGPRIFDQMNYFFPDKYHKKWVEESVVFIHYYGKKKPWNERERYDFSIGAYYFEMETNMKLDRQLYEEKKAIQLRERGMERDGTI